jgi:DoxX-like family
MHQHATATSSPSALNTASATTSSARSNLVYWMATGLFFALFAFSAIWTLVDVPGAEAGARRLNFPANLMVPLALAGIAAIVWRRSTMLKEFAFAGFLFDLLLAGSQHLYQRDGEGVPVVVGLVLWAGAYYVDRRRFGADRVK